MKMIFMGTPDFAVGILEALVAAGHEISLVVSQPDKPKGRGHESRPTPVKAAALAHGLPVFQPERIREAGAVERLDRTEAEVIVVAAFGQIIPKRILEMKRYGCVNVHASLLPKYRGAAPIQWAILNGEKESGVTMMQMDEGLDTGDILSQAAVPLSDEETGGSLFEKLSAAGARLCVETLDRLEKGGITPEKQGESPTGYAAMLKKEMGRIDWARPAAELERQVRAFNPWPSAYTGLHGKTLKIWKSQVVPDMGDESKGASGEILDVTKDSLIVRTGAGALAVTELQLEGKKRMDTGAFLRGFSVERGTVLGKE